MKFEKVTGYRRYDFVGKRIDSLPGLTPYFEILQNLKDCKEVAASGRVARNVNVKIKSKSGRILKFMMSITPIGYRGVSQKLCITAKCEGEEIVSEIPSVDISSEVPYFDGKNIPRQLGLVFILESYSIVFNNACSIKCIADSGT